MQEIAKAIQEGAMAYLKRQFRTIGVILIPLAVVVFLTSTAVDEARRHRGAVVRRSRARSARWRSSLGCFMSGLTGFIGMSLADARQRAHRGRRARPARCPRR